MYVGSQEAAFDIIVVGGGAVGAATVIECLDAGLRRIAWISLPPRSSDSASTAAGAMLGAYGEIAGPLTDPDEREEFEFRLIAQGLYGEWLKNLRDRSGLDIFEARGTFVVGNAAGTGDREILRNILEYSKTYDGDAGWVTPDEVPGSEPADRYQPVGCIHLPWENAVSTDNLLDAIRMVAAESDAITPILEEVVATQRTGSGWRALTKEASYNADHLIICAGSRTNALLPKDGPSLPTLPELYFGKGVSTVVSSEVLMTSTIRTPNRAFACGAHVVPRGEGTLYLGATNFFGTNHAQESGAEVGELHILFDQVIHQINTELRRSKLLDVRQGFRPVTNLRFPIIGSILPGLYVATGTYRNGVLMAPLIGKLIAEEIAGKSSTLSNPFPPTRFANGHQSRTMDWIVETGIQDIVAILHEPNGALPYGRSKELTKFLTVLFKLALDDNDPTGLRHSMRRTLTRIPINETMNRLFYEVIAHGDSDRWKDRQP